MLRFTWDTSRFVRDFAYRPFTVYGRPFQIFLLSPSNTTLRSRNPQPQAVKFGLFPVRSPLLRESLFVLYSSGYLDVSLRLVSLLESYVFRLGSSAMMQMGFPHSEIFGSTRACHSPKLIAAYHVLHRLLMPRHPLCALSSLTK